MKAIITLATASLMLAPAAFAQTTTEPATPNSPPAQTSSAPAKMTTIQQRMKSDLQKAGFTNVQVMPDSFLVKAKDKSGNPVTMIIGPTSMTEVVAQVAPSAGSSSGATSKTANGAGNTDTTSQ